MYFHAIGLPPELDEYEQRLMAARGSAAEDILRPFMEKAFGNAITHGGKCRTCARRGETRYGIHCAVKTPGGMKIHGHADAMLQDDLGLIIVDYKSITPNGFEYRIKQGPGEKNAAQVNLYTLARHLKGVGVQDPLLIYYDMAGGRLHGARSPFSIERANEDMELFDRVKKHELMFARALHEMHGSSTATWEHEGPDVHKLAQLYAPACVSNSKRTFPCSFEKDGKRYTCPFFGQGCGNSHRKISEIKLDKKNVPMLDKVYVREAKTFLIASKKAKEWTALKKKASNMLVNTLARLKVFAAQAEGVGKVKLRTRTSSGIKKSAIPADILAMIPDEAKWQVEYSFVEVEPEKEGDK